MLIDKSIADDFLARYKAVMTFLNGGEVPADIAAYASLRSLLFEKLYEVDDELIRMTGVEFVNTLKRGIFGRFVYLKKYQKGYVLQNIDSGNYYQVSALTTPLEDFVSDYSLIDTAILPYSSSLVCDGLVLSHGVCIGKNMAKDIRDGYWDAKRSGELNTNA